MNIKKILQSIVVRKSSVKLHEPWGYYIETRFAGLHMIGLIPNGEGVELCFYFADTQQQSRDFYRNPIKLEALEDPGWHSAPNFHFENSYGKNMLWAQSRLPVGEYIRFWRTHTHLLRQHSISELPSLVSALNQSGVLSFSQDDMEKYVSELQAGRISRFNVCAGLGVTYFLSSIEIARLQKLGRFEDFLIEKINEGLGVINETGEFFLKDTRNSDRTDEQREGSLGDPASEGDPPWL